MGKRIKRDENSRLRELLEESAISINVFVKRCLGLYNDEIMKAKLTHKDLTHLYPKLKRTSFEAIMDDPRCLSTGQVVVVIDANNNIIPYQYSKDEERKKSFLQSADFEAVMSSEDWMEDTTEWDKSKEHAPGASSHDLHGLSKYDLECLMELYIKLGQWRDYETVRKELTSRKDCSHANRNSKRLALERSMKKHKDEFDY